VKPLEQRRRCFRRDRAADDYVNLIVTTSALPHTVHSYVRKSRSGSSAGSIRAKVVGIPHFEQDGRCN
jgi:hypothetical protein